MDEFRTRILPADMFSLRAVFLEMVTAFPEVNRHAELLGILRTNWQGKLFLTESIDKVDMWLNEFKKCVEEKRESLYCQAEILSVCQRMLKLEKDIRPSAEELCRGWSNEL
ncbi:hypothetical protein B0T10DRAFT_466277 [Thelonectria olida]|uniref:Uncharacterized protein n=1 Tax=Thelonectria olida TaxID=1576542 RepID=A0A9P8VS36_9HYPO|nr:hypothetical protein B0T10DRAFT_466277 [Thelonectria olida]